jgi:sugar (pentulose or hexulose) kinase
VEFILAIDCGSTNLKAGLFDGALRPLGKASIPVAYTVRDAERAELDPEAIVHGVTGLIREACRSANVPARSVTRLALAGQAQTFVLLDGEGRALTPFISWLDKRAREESDTLAAALGRGFHEHVSFSAPTPALQLSKMLWLRRHAPELWARARGWASVPGYIAGCLFGVNLTDRNLAAMGGLYSLRAGDWWSAAEAQLGAAPSWRPLLVDVGGAVAAKRVPAGVGMPDELRIVSAGNDQTAGACGNGCGDGDLLITLGTALVAYRVTGNVAGPYHPGGCWGPYPGGGYYELATHDGGCAALDWARGECMPGASPRRFDEAADTVGPGSEGIEFHPERARTPGAWRGEGAAARKARAALEGIGYGVRSLIENGLEARTEQSSICVVGGGSKSAVWMRMLADILNHPVRPGRGDAVLGAARMAAGGIAAPGGGATAFAPDPARAARYRVCYEEWIRHEKA